MTDAAARREARMRRILENADNRLKKITNVNSPSCNNTVTEELTDEVQESPKPLTNHNNVFHHYTEDYEEIDPLPVETKKPKLHEPTDEKEKDTHTVYNYRFFIIILLGITVRYMNLIFDQFEELIGIDLSFMRIEKIFAPLLVYELTEVLFFKPHIEESGAFNLLLSLNNVNPERFKRLFKVINFFLGILKDMSVYFFAFVILDLLFTFVDIEY